MRSLLPKCAEFFFLVPRVTRLTQGLQDMVFDDADDRFETSFMRTRLVFKKARRRPNDRFASADREVVSSRYGGKQITICNKS